jgi:hypothetical protein
MRSGSGARISQSNLLVQLNRIQLLDHEKAKKCNETSYGRFDFFRLENKELDNSPPIMSGP